MVDVSEKYETFRFARAVGRIRLPGDVVSLIREGKVQKGDVLAVSEVAGMMAAKRVSELLPYCHPIPVDMVEVKARLTDGGVEVEALVCGVWRTGYEMEAMLAVTAALLNVYDMCKMYTSSMAIEEVRLVEKGGGKSQWYQDLSGVRFAVVTVSDSAFEGTREDRTGPALKELIESEGGTVVATAVVPDEKAIIAGKVKELCHSVDVVVLAGGTGPSARDVTPEALEGLIVKRLPGFGELMRGMGVRSTPRAIISRCFAGVAEDGTLVMALPGSVGGATDSFKAVLPVIKHTLDMIRGGGH